MSHVKFWLQQVCHQYSLTVNNFYSWHVINWTYFRIKERKSRKYQAFEIILLLNWWHRDFIITVRTMDKIKLEIYFLKWWTWNSCTISEMVCYHVFLRQRRGDTVTIRLHPPIRSAWLSKTPLAARWTYSRRKYS